MASEGATKTLGLEGETQHAYQELIASEESYGKSMALLVDGDKNRKKSLLKAFDNLPKEKREEVTHPSLEAMLNAMAELYAINGKIITALKKPDLKEVKNLFFQAQPYYANYQNAFNPLPRALKINELPRSFSARFHTAQQVSDILIMPVQRLPRYVMLFKILQKVPKENLYYPDFQDLLKAVEKISAKIGKTDLAVSQGSLSDSDTQLRKLITIAPVTKPSRMDLHAGVQCYSYKNSYAGQVKKGLNKFFDILNSPFLKKIYGPVPDKSGLKERQVIIVEKMLQCISMEKLEMSDIYLGLYHAYPSLFGENNSLWSKDSPERTQWMKALLKLIKEARKAKNLSSIGLSLQSSVEISKKQKRKVF